MEINWRDVARKRQAEVKKLQKRVDKLESILQRLIQSKPSNPPCICFIHKPSEQHELGPCPCCGRWDTLMYLAAEILKR